MPHIHTEPGQHDLTVSAFITNRHQQILVHKHKKLNRYLQHGGHVELHEDPWTAVLREIREETGYSPEQLILRVPPMMHVMKYTDDPTVFHPYPVSFNTHQIADGHYHTDIGYAFVVLDDIPDTPVAEGESTDSRWLEIEDIDVPEYNIPCNVRTIMHYILGDSFKLWSYVDVSYLIRFQR